MSTKTGFAIDGFSDEPRLPPEPLLAFDDGAPPTRRRREGGFMKSEELGPRLRAARMKTRQSLRSVATAVGVSPSLLSQVETGKTHPSVSTLYALVNVLGISVDELLGTGARTVVAPNPGNGDADRAPLRAIVQRAKDNPVLEMENGVQWQRLAAPTGSVADCMLVTYKPGAASSLEGRLMRHFGSEHAYILEGELTLQIEFDEYAIRAGDSIFFDSQLPHLYTNKTDKLVKGVWLLIGRREMQGNATSMAVSRPDPSDLRNAVDVLQTWDGYEHVDKQSSS